MATVLIGGGSGLIGMHLSKMLQDKGYDVLHLSRQKKAAALFPTFQWDIDEQQIDETAVQKSDYVINLAGAGIADAKWTAARKRLIIHSRVASTRLLIHSFKQRSHPPKAFISASAIGYYGDRGAEWLGEEASAGSGFLAESCTAWEAAVAEAAQLGWRTVIGRVGIVLSTQGGALPKMLLPLKMHLATYFGDGQQYYSWIHIDDLCRIFIKAIEDDQMSGIYNACGPAPIGNQDFIQTLAAAMNKTALPVPTPAFALRMAMGEMADVVLSSARVATDKIQMTGFQFQHPALEAALRDLINRSV